MKILSIFYSAFLVLFCLQTTFLILATAHEVDLSFLIINILSIIIFTIAAYCLYKFYYSKMNRSLLIILLLPSIFIFGYYAYAIFSKGDTKSLFSYQPLVGLFLGLLFLINVSYRSKSRILNSRK